MNPAPPVTRTFMAEMMPGARGSANPPGAMFTKS